MAAQVLNDMPDAEVQRGEPLASWLRETPLPRQAVRLTGRAAFMLVTLAIHVAAGAAFVSMNVSERVPEQSMAIMATILDGQQSEPETPPEYVAPLNNVVYALVAPQELLFEAEIISPAPVVTAAISAPAPEVIAPPMIETVEYVRAPAPVYPTESSRKRERGTVVLRVLVDTIGRPAQIRVERSSGHARLDSAAREAVEKALFRPYEVNGIAQPAQVLVPIEFMRRAT